MLKERKEIFIITLLGYLLLFFFTIIFFKERLNVDTSYYFFKTLNTQWFHIEHDRYVLAIAELPILIGNYLHASLKTIAIAYSIWHTLFFFLLGFFSSRYYMNHYYFLLFLLLQLVGIFYSFLCPVFEQYYGTAILAGFYIILRNSKQLKLKNTIILFLFAFFAVTSHPFNLILYTFLLLLDFTDRKNKWLLISFLALIPLYLISKYFFISEYEKGKVDWIFNTTNNKTYLRLLELSHWKAHAIFLFQYYKEALITYALYAVFALRQRLIKQLILVGLFFIATILLINFSYAVVVNSGYIEQVCYLLVPIVFIPFFVDILPTIQHKVPFYLILIMTSCCVGYRLFLQGNLAKDNTQKTERIKQWIVDARKQASCKNYVLFNQFSDLNTLLGWDISYSSLIFSAFDKNKMQVSIVHLEDNNTKELDSIESGSYLFRFGEVKKINTLNTNYFNFCTDASYKNLYPPK